MQVSKRLVVRKEIPIDNSRDLISSMDVAMAEYYCQNNNYERGLELFREAIQEIPDEAERNFVINKYIGQAIQYAQRLSLDKKYIEAIEQYRNIMKYSGFPINIYKNIGLCMKSIGNADLAIKFLKRFEEISPDKEDVYVYLADLTYTDIKDNKKAIEYYEKALERNLNNFSIYNMLIRISLRKNKLSILPERLNFALITELLLRTLLMFTENLMRCKKLTSSIQNLCT